MEQSNDNQEQAKPTPPSSQIIKEGHDPRPRVDKKELEYSIKSHESAKSANQTVKK